MSDPALTHLLTIPWVSTLLASPDWTPTHTASRLPKPSGEDSFFAETLASGRTIRTCLTLRPTKAVEGDKLVYHEMLYVMDLGEGVNGFPGICHGGFVATMLDEACGLLIVLNLENGREREDGQGVLGEGGTMYMTAYLHTHYKRPIPTPSTVLCKAKVDRRDGRKLYISATIEDGKGSVYTVGEGMFVELKANM